MPLASADLTSNAGHQSEVTDALARVLDSKLFTDVPRLSRFLKFVVNETLAGRGERLKGFVIACEVFDKTDPSDAQTTTIVRVEAGRLRRRLADYYSGEGADDTLRISIPKGGYKPVFEAITDPKEIAASHPPPVSETVPIQASSQRHLGGRALVIGALSAFVLVATIALFTSRDSAPPSPPPAAAHSTPSLAVLPLESFNTEPGQADLGLAIADSLIAALSKQSDIHVTALSSAEYFRSKADSVRDIGSDLGVSHVLTGRYSNSGDSAYITVTLHDARSGYATWSDEFAFEKNWGPREITPHITRGISEQLGLKPTAPASFPEDFDPDRFALYNQARNLTHPPANKLRVNLALGIFETLIANYPDFTSAYAGAAYSRAAMVWWQHSEHPQHDIEIASTHARNALELDADNGLAYLSVGMLEMAAANHEAALTAMRQAVEVQPSNALALSVLGMAELWAGRKELSADLVQEAIRLDPLNTRVPYWNILGIVQFYQDNYALSIEAFRENNRRGGPRAPSHDYHHAAALMGAGHEAEARALLQDRFGGAHILGWQSWERNNFRDKSDLENLLSKLDALGVPRQSFDKLSDGAQ